MLFGTFKPICMLFKALDRQIRKKLKLMSTNKIFILKTTTKYNKTIKDSLKDLQQSRIFPPVDPHIYIPIYMQHLYLDSFPMNTYTYNFNLSRSVIGKFQKCQRFPFHWNKSNHPDA